ncbi:glycosyltransferase [Synechococcales cyanobacterium C]|uniref:Glycosyltransferase n=1 Tax=Petrachloros mirabilis ULC683 TaxID=2781853 RepID=A0A8K2A0T5_9CYAN|nr:glycosyltransferase family A protein [Petrachloros mirabilis]NCJ07496.1 glycosyltransferase [Petrachloros mirabilis ULC683]
MPKITVIIPAYNAMGYLPHTLRSVLQQTYADFEVLIINDGSSDGIEDWFQQGHDPRVQMISQSNLGLAGARNTGIHHSKGDYLAFLDADDLWQPTKLAKQVQCLDAHPEVGLVYCWVTYIDETGQCTGRIFRHQDKGWVWPKLTAHNIVECGSVPLVRRTCFDTLGGFDQTLKSYVEDWDMWLRIAWENSFAVVEEPLVYYRQTSGSASRNWQAMEASFHRVIEKAFENKSEFETLKSRSYGEINLCLAWKCLQGKDCNLAQSQEFCKKALKHWPKLLLYREYWRLSAAIFLRSFLGRSGYAKFLRNFYVLRRTWLGVAPRFNVKFLSRQ